MPRVTTVETTRRVLDVLIAAGRGPRSTDYEVAAVTMILKRANEPGIDERLAEVIKSKTPRAWRGIAESLQADRYYRFESLVTVWCRELGIRLKPGPGPGGARVKVIQRDSDCIIDVQAPVPPGPHPSDAAAPSTKPLKNNNPAESADTISRTHVGDGPSKPVGSGRRAHVGGLEIDDDGRVTNGSRAVWIGTDGTRLVTALARVRPALLGIDRLISKTFGGNVSDGAVRLKTLIENVNPRLKGIGLEIRIVHKIGCVLADV